jgi:hypothetical protein
MPPRFPPFTSAERTPIFIGLTLGALLAIWCVVRAFRERTGLKRWGWLGAGIFLLLFMMEGVAVVRESPLFTENPQRILILPITGMASIACLFVIFFKISAERNVRTAPQQQLKEETAESRLFLLRGAVIYAIVLAVLLPGMLLSLYGQLWGPPRFFPIGVAGFLLAMAVFFLGRERLGIRFLRIYPNGLSGRYLWLQDLKVPLRRTMIFAAFCATIGLVILAATARIDGVPGIPVFFAREHYYLSNHSMMTEVSRLRYCLAGVGFNVGWYAGASCALLLALHALFFGYVPKRFGKYRADSADFGETK